MSPSSSSEGFFDTREVTNQSPPFEEVNLFTSALVLHEAVAREGAEAARDDLIDFGALVGSALGFEIGRLANENLPRLRRVNRKGFPCDLVEFHPAYHEAMQMSFQAGLHCSPWEHLAEDGGKPAQGAHVARLAHLYMMTRMEPGHLRALPALRPALGASMPPGLVSQSIKCRTIPAPAGFAGVEIRLSYALA